MPMFEDFKITVFQTVASQGSFTKAASALGISQPAVSQNVAELEKQAGVKVFLRERGLVSLTPQGRILMKYASRTSSLGLAADRLFFSLPEMTVRVAASDEVWGFLLMPVLEDFMVLHPQVGFVRSPLPDADLSLSLVPSSVVARTEGAIFKVRASASAIPQSMGDLAAAHEKTIYFDLLFLPEGQFASSDACRLLKDLLTDSISL
ncbi:MAG: LysR family transcriptional regulator [Candidatus Cryptobacteroides sp.]